MQHMQEAKSPRGLSLHGNQLVLQERQPKRLQDLPIAASKQECIQREHSPHYPFATWPAKLLLILTTPGTLFGVYRQMMLCLPYC